MPNLSVRHITRYRYRRPVRLGEHRMMFRPRESFDQRVLESRLVIVPEPVEIRYVQDVFGNCVGVARWDHPTDELVFDSAVRLEHAPHPVANDVADALDTSAATYPFVYSVEDTPDLQRSIERCHADPDRALEAWARRFLQPTGPTRLIDALSDMTRAIRSEFTYGARLVGGAQTPLETLALGSGSCRDFAVLMIEAARSLGLAARFVSGYIYSPDAGRDDGRRGGGHTHAWVRVYLPTCGWVEFDPTNGIIGSDDLIRVAVARDPRQALPLSGTFFGSAEDCLGMDVSVDVAVEEPAEKRGRRLALAS